MLHLKQPLVKFNLSMTITKSRDQIYNIRNNNKNMSSLKTKKKTKKKQHDHHLFIELFNSM